MDTPIPELAPVNEYIRLTLSKTFAEDIIFEGPLYIDNKAHNHRRVMET